MNSMRPSGFQIPQIIATELTRYLEDEIIFGDLSPGTRLVEEDVVKRFNVSRSPVREAFRLLEQEGLVERASRKGISVSAISLEDLDEVYTCRLSLEGLAAELAAISHSDDDMNAIAEALDAQAAAHGRGDLRDFFRHNVALSGAIYAASGNRTLKRLLASIGKQSFRYRYLVYSNAPEMLVASLEGHQEIVAAMRKRNARHTRMLMEDLIQRSWNVMRRHFNAAAHSSKSG